MQRRMETAKMGNITKVTLEEISPPPTSSINVNQIFSQIAKHGHFHGKKLAYCENVVLCVMIQLFWGMNILKTSCKIRVFSFRQ